MQTEYTVREKCYKLGIKTSMPKYKPDVIKQLSLF